MENVDKEYLKVNIDCAERTIGKYKSHLEYIQIALKENSYIDSIDAAEYLDTSVKLSARHNDPRQCAYCLQYHNPGGSYYSLSCGDCPIAVATGKTSCVEYPEYTEMSSFIEDEHKPSISEFTEALNTRIKFHQDLIDNEGTVPDHQIRRFYGN